MQSIQTNMAENRTENIVPSSGHTEVHESGASSESSSPNAVKSVLKIRPHHLLCTRSYRGRGYSPAFTEHMNQIVRLLYCRKPGQLLTVQLTCSTDSICSCCPNKIAENGCRDNEKVCRYDQAVLKTFHQKEGLYDFDTLEASIEEVLTEDLVSKICSDCNWHDSCHCREEVVKGFHFTNLTHSHNPV